MTENDYYAWIPATFKFPNHRLSLRKNLKTGEYEVFRHYFDRKLWSKKRLTAIYGEDTDKEDVAFKSKDLEAAVKFANGEWNKYHGDEVEKSNDQVCQHKPPVVHRDCEGWAKTRKFLACDPTALQVSEITDGEITLRFDGEVVTLYLDDTLNEAEGFPKSFKITRRT